MNTACIVGSSYIAARKIGRYVIAGVGALIILALKPFICVRLGSLVSYRLGSYIMEAELALCEQEAGINQPSKFTCDIWFEEHPISNQALSVMWKRTLLVLPTALAHPIYLLITRTGILKEHIIRTSHRDRDVHGLLQKSQCHLNFSGAEVAKGTASMREFGIPGDGKWICIHSRDSSYLDDQFPESDFSYHSYRNSDIDTYVLMAEAMISLGYYVIRMGSRVAKPMSLTSKCFFDYGSSGKQTDLMDLYLISRCAFYVGGSAGLDSVAIAFRKPTVMTNYIPVANFQLGWQHLVIPKKLCLSGQTEPMTIEAIARLGLDDAYEAGNYRDSSVDIVDNTLEEIRDVAMEMHENLGGQVGYSEVDEILQEQFWLQFPFIESKHGTARLCRVGRQFLLNNPWLSNQAG